jgi:hypothetical protein
MNVPKYARTGAVLFVLGLTCAAGYAARRSLLAAGAFSQIIQNTRADAEDLSRMRDYEMILRFRRAGLLVPIPASTHDYYLHRISPKYRYLRPWAKLFLTRLSRQYHARFGRRLRVTALVRTAEYQRLLRARNANAATASGAYRSSHLTGATLDISKRFMAPVHTDWMRRVLYHLHQRKVIHAVEEFRQPCFHVMVHKSYRDYVRSLIS